MYSSITKTDSLPLSASTLHNLRGLRSLSASYNIVRHPWTRLLVFHVPFQSLLAWLCCQSCNCNILFACFLFQSLPLKTVTPGSAMCFGLKGAVIWVCGWGVRQRNEKRADKSNRMKREVAEKWDTTRALAPLRISQQTQQQPQRLRHFMWSDKNWKTHFNVQKTHSGRKNEGWWIFQMAVKTVITWQLLLCCLTHQDNKPLQRQMTCQIFCFVQES